MARSVKRQILEAAIEMFGLRGFHGVRTRDIARLAHVPTASIYNNFSDKQQLYQQALGAVIMRSTQELSHVLVSLAFDERQGEGSFQQLITNAIARWSESLPQSAARLLQQAQLQDPGDDKPRLPLRTMTDIVARTLEREWDGRSMPKDFNPKVAAEILVNALFQIKVTSGQKTAAQQIPVALQQWLLGFSPS